MAAFLSCSYRYLTTRFGEFNGIVNKVDQDLLKACEVGPHAGQPLGTFHAQQ